MKLYPFQEHGAKFLSQNRQALLADEMGLGKTIQALTAAHILNVRKMLIVCPKSVLIYWAENAQKMFPHLSVAPTESTNFLPKTDIVSVNYDKLLNTGILKQALSRKYGVIIYDESHYLKNHNTKRTKACFGRGGIVHRGVYNWCLTGTPVLNRPAELYTALKVLRPDLIDNMTFFQYAEKFCAGYESKWGFDYSGASNLDELSMRLKFFMLRRLFKDVYSQLPPVQFQTIPIKVKVAQQDNLAAQRIETAAAKLDVAVEHISNVLTEKPKVVIFAYHHTIIGILIKSLSKYGVSVITGKTSSSDREIEVRKFQGSNRVFIGQIQAAGQSIDGLQKVCDTAIFVELSWMPGEINQAVGRLQRMGQFGRVLVQFLIAKDTEEESSIDDIMKGTTHKKSSIIKQIHN